MTGDRQKKTTSAPAGSQKATPSQRPGLRGDVLVDLRRNAAQLDEVLAGRYDLIAAARDQGITWAAIGQALGLTTQGAHGWFNTRATTRRPSGGRSTR